MKITMKGSDYILSTKLRVAYKLQGCNNHKPYGKIFEEIADQPIEKQIQALYVSFCVANPDMEDTISELEFVNYYLDNFHLVEVMEQIQQLIEGIMGKSLSEKSEEVATESVTPTSDLA